MQRVTPLRHHGNGLTSVRRTNEAITSFNFLTTKSWANAKLELPLILFAK